MKEIIGKCFILETPDDLKVLCHRESVFSLQSWSSELNGEDIFLFWGSGLKEFKDFLKGSATSMPTMELIRYLDNLLLVNIKITGKEAEIL